jgi:DNA-directed RNA polymerase subunit RPC12/RpoP
MGKKPKRDPNILSFLCGRCRAPVTAPMAMAGRFMECPKCKAKSPVPESQKEADDDARDLGVQRDFYEPVDGKCFKCSKKMSSKDAVVCLKCGFNHRDGKQMVTRDDTVRDDEARRGGPALTNMILALLVGLALLGAMAWRLLDDTPKIWWEQAIYLSLSSFLLLLTPPLFLQWNTYRSLPIRDHAGVKEENRAEREEALSPYDTWTLPVFVLCVLVGGGIMLFAFSRNPDTKAFQWPWDATADNGPVVR